MKKFPPGLAEKTVAATPMGPSRSAFSADPSTGPTAPPAPLPWGRIVAITLGAVALFVGFRFLPTGTNLSHMDFRATGQNVIETCDPANPQFIPVVAVKSPVVMSLALAAPARSGAEVTVTATLNTASGKAIAPEDLVVMHTKLLHLLIVDPTLTDYQHIHPVPGHVPGTWNFQFIPRRSGIYRVFADFTPVATGRGLYANADVIVTGGDDAKPAIPATAISVPSGLAQPSAPSEKVGDYLFMLAPGQLPIRARQAADLKFTVARLDGARVPMEPVMGAYAHLVAFDEARSGFAHLHPMELALIPPPDALRPTLNFKITIPTPGRYVIWSQVNLAGRELFAPFWFDVVP